MKIPRVYIVMLFSVMFSCDSENEGSPGETSLLTVSVDASYPTEASDNWIIVHSENGSLLAFESFEANQELEIITDKSVSGKIMITHLSYTLTKGGTKWYIVESYANIEKGKHIVIKDVSISVENTGNINVSISDVNTFESASLSDGSGADVLSSGWSSSEKTAGLASYTHAGASKFITTLSDGNSIKYKIINNVQPNDSYSFSFNDMDPVDQKVSFTFPQQPNNIIFYVYGQEPGATTSSSKGYMLMQYLSNKNSTTVHGGYLNSLTNYTTLMTIFYPGYTYEYKHFGSIPSSQVEWPQQSDFSITKTSLGNFFATSSKTYVWRNSVWRSDDAPNKTYVRWNISSSSDKHIIKELPSEILSAHPALSFDNLDYTGTTFYTVSPTFESIVSKDFGTGQEPTGLQLGINILN